MIPWPEMISNRDVHQWVHNCWVLDTATGMPAKVMHLGDDQVGVHLMGEGDMTPADEQYMTYDAFRSRFRAHWPRLGSINLDRVAIWVEKEGTRSYRRSYNPVQVTLTWPDKWHALRFFPPSRFSRTHPKDSEVVVRLFRPIYFEWDEAVRKMTSEGWFSVAISRHIILSRTGGVFYRGARIGGLSNWTELRRINTDLPEYRINKLLQGRVICIS